MKFLHKKLDERRENGTLRSLKPFSGGIDFYSNDYLGMATHEEIHVKAKNILLEKELFQRNGSGGSRLLSGNFAFYEEVESYLADFFGVEAALVYHSGYDALLGTLSCLPTRSDTVLYDDLVHASARDGIRLSAAKSFSFRHNDLLDLESKIKRAEGNVFVVVESLYSMDGDTAPLDEMYELQKKYGFVWLIDEAHSGGIYGEKGKGLSHQFSGNENIIRFITFGKAYGVEGACVLGSKALRDYLVNFSRSFIYTTAPAPEFFAKIKSSVEIVSAAHEERMALNENIQTFINTFSYHFPCTNSPIQIYKAGSKKKLLDITNQLLEVNITVRPIFYPTVREGEERLRIILHAFNNEFQIENLAMAIILK
jgi:8-amino-7-oxononanoate synthase